MSVDPCQDDKWLDFVCSRRVFGLRNKKDYYNEVKQVAFTVTEQTKNILRYPSPINEKDFLFQEARTYYFQCRNKGQHDEMDSKAILKYVTERYGEGPIFSNKDPSKDFPWVEMVADMNRLERQGYKSLFLEVEVTQGVKVGIGRVSLTYTLNSVGDYKKMVNRLQKKAGLKEPAISTQVASALSYMSKMNTKLLKNMTAEDGEFNFGDNFKEFSLSELQKESDKYLENTGTKWKFNWSLFLERALNGSTVSLKDTKLSPNITLPFDDVMFLIETVHSAISSNNTYNRKAIVNGMFFNLVTMLVQETTSIVDDLSAFRCNDYSGNRDDICLKRVTEIFGYSLGKSFLTKHYDDAKITPMIERIMADIKSGYKKTFDSLDFLNSTEKALVKGTVENITVFIAQPPWMREKDGLEKYYNGLTAATKSGDSYLSNFIHVNEWAVAKQRQFTKKQAENGKDFNITDLKWGTYSGEVNAYYWSRRNQAFISAGILQPPLFGINKPGFINYGGVGMVLAHEVGHSFLPTQTTSFFSYSDFKNEKVEQWVNKISLLFAGSEHKISDNFRYNQRSGATVSEDVADILGIYISYYSYNTYLKELAEQGKKEKVLPGLKSFTPQELFFMKYGNMWCDNQDVQDRYEQLVSGDVHSPGNARAALPLKFMDEFADTFNCTKKPLQIPTKEELEKIRTRQSDL